MATNFNLLTWATSMEKQAGNSDLYTSDAKQYPYRFAHKLVGGGLGTGVGGLMGLALGGYLGNKASDNPKTIGLAALLGLLGGGALGGYGGVKLADTVDDEAEDTAIQAEVNRELAREKLRKQMGLAQG